MSSSCFILFPVSLRHARTARLSPAGTSALPMEAAAAKEMEMELGERDGQQGCLQELQLYFISLRGGMQEVLGVPCLVSACLWMGQAPVCAPWAGLLL